MAGKDSVLQVRMTSRELEGLRLYAQSKGKTVSSVVLGLIRGVLRGGVGEVVGDAPAMSAASGVDLADLLVELQQLVELGRDQRELLEEMASHTRPVAAAAAVSAPAEVVVTVEEAPGGNGVPAGDVGEESGEEAPGESPSARMRRLAAEKLSNGGGAQPPGTTSGSGL